MTQFVLGDLFEFSNGVNASKDAYGSGIPFANVLEVITNEGLHVGDIPGRMSLSGDLIRRYQVRRGDVLFNRSSETQDEVGISSTYLDDVPIVFGGFVLRGRPKTAEFVVEYSQYALRASDVRAQIIARGQGGIRANIGQRDLATVAIDLPDVSEQRVIARRLDDSRELTRMLERLIEKKRLVRVGIMQRLFGGNHPAKELLPLGELASFLSGGTPRLSNESYWRGNIPWISAVTLKKLEVRDSDRRVTAAAVAAASRMAPLNSTLLLVRGSALHSEIRASLVVGAVCFNQDVKALVPKSGVLPKFLTYSLHANSERLLRMVTSAGNTAGVLDTRSLKEMQIWVPDPVRQGEIVSILDDVANELEALERRLESAHAITEGMMQELLSARTHLVEGAAA